AGRLQLRPAVGLAVGGEHDAAVGQVVRVEIIAGVGQLVVGDHAPQAAAVQGILPDVPGRVVRAAHGEDQPAAVVGDVGTAHVAPAAGVLVGDVVRRGAGRGQLAQVQVSAGNEGYAVGCVSRRFERAVGVGDGVVATHDDAAAAAAAASRGGNQCERQQMQPDILRVHAFPGSFRAACGCWQAAGVLP